MWKFFGKTQFPHSFGRETVPFHKISTSEKLVEITVFYAVMPETIAACNISESFQEDQHFWIKM